MIHRADLSTIWLLGKPVHHSLSPLIQNTVLKALQQKVVYLAAPVEPEDFNDVVRALPKFGVLGANVTVPHKLLAFEICDTRSERAQRMGAVNTLVFDGARIHGDNTDGAGWWHSLPRDRRQTLRRAVIVGAGGAARAVAHTLVQQGVRELVILNRTLGRAAALIEELRPYCQPQCQLQAGELSAFSQNLSKDVLVVQTTSVGQHDQAAPVEWPEQLPSGIFLSELIYGKTTKLMKSVLELGGEAQDGLGMLCGQGAESLALWLKRPVQDIPLGLMLQAAREHLTKARD